MNTISMTAWERLYKITVLREELRRVNARIVRYRFCAFRFVEPEYYIEIVFESERAAARLDTDYPMAQILFDRLVDGLVTPCTLANIMEDIKNAR